MDISHVSAQVSIDKPTKRPSRETDAVRPKDEKEVGLLKRKDPYGHYKLSCEEALSYYQREKSGFPWVSLRLADVIGPRDTTNRSLSLSLSLIAPDPSLLLQVVDLSHVGEVLP